MNRRNLIAAGIWLAIATIALGAVAAWSPPGWLAVLSNAVVLFFVFRLQAELLPGWQRLPRVPLLVASAVSVALLIPVALSAPTWVFPMAAAVLIPAVFAAVARQLPTGGAPGRAGLPR
jgi:hypothetical protein